MEQAKAEARAAGMAQAEAVAAAKLASERQAWQSDLQRQRAEWSGAADARATAAEAELASMRVMAASLQREALATQARTAELEVGCLGACLCCSAVCACGTVVQQGGASDAPPLAW